MQKDTHYNLTTDIEIGAIPFNRYPRPQMKRSNWINLNGEWECGVIVPFPLESELSGFKGDVPEEYTYFRTFDYKPKRKKRLLLHFGAVDQICDVYVDNQWVGTHKGGYLPFNFDITEALDDKVTHILKVDITDTLDVTFPHGKQSNNRGGMWYTPVTGIWQTVWLEEVPDKYIHNIRIKPSLGSIELTIDGDASSYNIEIMEPAIYNDSETPKTGKVILRTRTKEKTTVIQIPSPKNWTPKKPFLYGIRIGTKDDLVESYFALRTVRVKKKGNFRRICLNGRPIFLHAVLDQGYFPEGIFLPNSEEGYEQDIINMKKLGINTLRKHIKIEPECFYEACDRLGMLVMQDMVNNSDYSFMRDTALPTFGFKGMVDHFLHKNPESRAFFKQHMIDTVNHLYNHPCICYYTIFNEGWGQFNSDEMYETLKSIDRTRIVDSTSGWFKQIKSDVWSRHVYFRPISPIPHVRPTVVSEFGGYSYIEKGHVYSVSDNYGYRICKTREALSADLKKLYDRDIIPYIAMGLSGAVYTQLSDVEDETNGLYTYDRKVLKVSEETLLQIAQNISEAMKKI